MEFPAHLVQESKHCAARFARFAKLKGMLGTYHGKFNFVWLLLCACLGAISLGGAHALPPQVKQPAPKPEENTLAHEIRHQLQVLPYYSVFDYITFRLEGSKVTLTGQVVRHTLQRDAEAAVRSIEGVSSVTNAIEVLPKSPADDDLRRAVYRAVYEDTVLQRYAVAELPLIHIIVKDATVTLEGSVENENDKKLAASRASGVSGVSGVANHLAIHSKAAPAS